MFEEQIIESLQKEVKQQIVLEVPPDTALGDFAFPCFSLAKEFKKSPMQIAQDLAKKIQKPTGVEKIVATGPYVNFFLDTKKVAQKIIGQVLKEKKKFGSSKVGKGKVVCVDFGSPNIGKPLHFGNLRTTMLGNSLALLHEFAGYKVLRLNYLGDWGTQFGMLIAAYLKWGNKKKFDDSPVQHLVELYVRFNKEAESNNALEIEARNWFSKLEKGDKQARGLWSKFRAVCLGELKKLYKILDIKYDSFNGEAHYAPKVDAALERLEKKKIAELDEGALIVRLPGHEMPMMLRKSDGSTTYASRDVALIVDRVENLKGDIHMYVVGNEQSLHFQQLFGLAKMMGFTQKFVHVGYGLYLAPSGGKMSARKGTGVTVESVLDEAISIAKKTIEEKNPSLKNKEEVARQVAVGALFFGDMMNERSKDIVFDLDRFLSFEGDTGPYLMYTHARAASILQKAKKEKLSATKGDVGMLINPVEQRLIKLLPVFSQKIEHALVQYKPHILAQFLLEFGRTFNEFYHSCPCLQEPNNDLKLARLALIEASRQVLENGLALLGITAPFEM